MLIAAYIFAGILTLIIILAAIAPKSYDVSRSILIEKPKEIVYPYLKLTKNQDYWSPWKKRDPDMKQSFEGTDGEVGFVSRWDGNKEVGKGSQTITGLIRK